MTDELKPVRCGCGGEASVKKHSFYRALPLYSVKCDKCGIQVPSRNTEAEAVTAWNRAMSGNVQECAKDARCTERTAKVDRDAIFPVEVCSICHSTVDYPNKYCSECGAKLDWSEDE